MVVKRLYRRTRFKHLGEGRRRLQVKTKADVKSNSLQKKQRKREKKKMEFTCETRGAELRRTDVQWKRGNDARFSAFLILQGKGRWDWAYIKCSLCRKHISFLNSLDLHLG